MGRRPMANGATARVCTNAEGRHLAFSSRRPDSHTVHPSDASMLRPHERYSATFSCSNVVVLHPRRAQLDGQLAACSIDGRALAPCRRSWIHGGLLQCCRQRGFRRHTCVLMSNAPIRHPQRTRHYGWLAARSVMFVCMTTTAVRVDHRGAQLSCNGLATWSSHFARAA